MIRVSRSTGLAVLALNAAFGGWLYLNNYLTPPRQPQSLNSTAEPSCDPAVWDAGVCNPGTLALKSNVTPNPLDPQDFHQEPIAPLTSANWKTNPLPRFDGADRAHRARIELNEFGQAIAVSGQIQRGDAERLRAVLLKADHARPLLIALNSPGGAIGEAQIMADLISYDALARLGTAGANVISFVDAGDVCGSACISLYASAPMRAVGRQKGHPDGQLVVHSMHEGDGAENARTLALDVQWARWLNAFGTPTAITGKLLSTAAPEGVTLSKADLKSWGVRTLRLINGKLTWGAL